MSFFLDALAYLFDGSHWSGDEGFGTQLVQQLLLTVVSLLVVAAIGLPLALWLGHLGKGGTFAINVSNIGRAVPVFAVLGLLSVGFVGSATFGPFGRAGLATLISLVLFGLPPVITNAYVGMREIDREVVEAARGMGMTESRIFWRIEAPLVLPLVLNGIRLAFVQIWATATIAALVGGPGLGRSITRGFANGDTVLVLAGAILVAFVALVLEGLVVLLERGTDPMRRARRRTAVRPQPVPVSTQGAHR